MMMMMKMKNEEATKQKNSKEVINTHQGREETEWGRGGGEVTSWKAIQVRNIISPRQDEEGIATSS